MVSVTSEPSVIGAATQLVGRVSGSGGVRLEGSLRGDVTLSGPLDVTAGASLEGNVEASELQVAGTLHGDAHTSGPIYVQAGASVRGELRGSQITIEPGASVAVRLGTEFELDW